MIYAMGICMWIWIVYSEWKRYKECVREAEEDLYESLRDVRK